MIKMDFGVRKFGFLLDWMGKERKMSSLLCFELAGCQECPVQGGSDFAASPSQSFSFV